MRLREVRSVADYGRWAQGRGFHVAEGPDPFGPVSPTAHVTNSLHYDLRAVDINYYGGHWGSESEALKWLYHRTLDHFRRHPNRLPLDEMFHDGLGFMVEYGPDVNHPIGGHDGHLHVGLRQRSW